MRWNLRMENNTNNNTIIDLSDATGISDLVAKISSVLDSDEYVNSRLFLKIGKVSLKQSQLLSIKALIEAMNSSLEGVETSSEMTEASAISLGISTKAPVQNHVPTFEETFKNASMPSFTINNEPEISSFEQLKKTNSIGDFVTDTAEFPEVEADESLQIETEEFLNEAESEDILEQEVLEESSKDDVQEENIYERLSAEQEISAPKDVQSALDVTFGESFYTNASIYQQNDDETETADTCEKTETIKNENDAKYILLDTEGITPEGIELIKSNTSDLDTLYLTQTLRSGQTVSYEGNIFIVGDVHPGSEVNATGDVTVWGILGGIVHAGSAGNTDAKVRALKLNPIQLRIANLYSRRNDTINVPYVQKTNEFTPEEARIDRNQIVIYKTLRRED